jgi:hypothetical protein
MQMNKEHADWLHQIVKPLFSHLPSLCPMGVWDLTLEDPIEAISIEALTAGNNERQPYGLAVKAGLLLFNESLDKSHTLSQEIINQSGGYWHGLMHRMEGDYSNAKYWFADTGHHPISTLLVTRVSEYLSEQDLAEMEHESLRSKLEVLAASPVWNPAVFVDAIELQVMHVQHAKVEEWLRHIQQFEMKLLLNYCYEQSCGGSLFEAIGEQ